MKIRRSLAARFAAAAFLVPAGAALADNCYNASRPGKDLSTNPADFSAPLFKGRWLWLPSVGAPIAAWGFEVPQNYQNRGGAEAWLLENTPYRAAGGVLSSHGPRTARARDPSGGGVFGCTARGNADPGAGSAC